MMMIIMMQTQSAFSCLFFFSLPLLLVATVAAFVFLYNVRGLVMFAPNAVIYGRSRRKEWRDHLDLESQTTYWTDENLFQLGCLLNPDDHRCYQYHQYHHIIILFVGGG
jgi:hypothetical protein